MIAKYKYGGLVWIDLESPQNEELLYLEEEYPDIDLSKDNLLKIVKNKNFNLTGDNFSTFLIIPNLDTSKINENISIDKNELFIFVNKNLIVTIHDKYISSLREILKELEINIYQNANKQIDSKLLLINFLKKLYTNSEKELLKNTIHAKELLRTMNKHKNKYKRLQTLFILFLIGIILYYVISII